MPLLILNRSAAPPADGWYQIEVSGEHPVGDGRTQVIDAPALQRLCTRFAAEAQAAGEAWAGVLVDADHLSHDQEQSTAVFGWLKEMDIRNGQLHGRIELTDLGEPAIANRRFKFFSTEYAAADLEDLGGGRVRPGRLAGLALTNRPNNRGGKPISNRETDSNTNNHTTMKSIAEKLGLAAEATEAEILTALDALLQTLAAQETKDQEGQADAVMNRLGSRIPEAARPQWRAALIANRETTEQLMEKSFPVPGDNRGGRSQVTPLQGLESLCAFAPTLPQAIVCRPVGASYGRIEPAHSLVKSGRGY